MLEAIFVSGVNEIKVSGLFQWDRGQMLRITCPDLPAAFQVHFAKRKSKTTIDVQAESAGNVATVAIPDVLLQDYFDLYAYLYFDEGVIGETVKTIRMPIKARVKPDDYVIDLPQEQQTDAEKLIEKMLDEYVEAEVGAVASASESAAAAEAAKAGAEKAKEAAEESVKTAVRAVEEVTCDVYSSMPFEYNEAATFIGAFMLLQPAPYDGVIRKVRFKQGATTSGKITVFAWDGEGMTSDAFIAKSRHDIAAVDGVAICEIPINAGEYIGVTSNTDDLCTWYSGADGAGFVYTPETSPRSYVGKYITLSYDLVPSNSVASKVEKALEPVYDKMEDLDAEVQQALDEFSAIDQSIVQSVEGKSIAVNDSAERPLKGLKLYGKTKQKKSTGAQLLDYSTMKGNTIRGVKFSVGEDSLRFEGTATGSTTSQIYSFSSMTLTPGTYTLGVDHPLPFNIRFNSTSSLVLRAGQTSVTSAIAADYTINHIAGSLVSGTEYDEEFKLMLSKSDAALPYEPYTGGLPAPTPDNPQELKNAGADGEINVSIAGEDENAVHTFAVSTPNGLPGVPVESGGNYTDSNGQQWVCDEIDFRREVSIQRIGCIESYNGEVIPGVFMSTAGALVVGAKVLYALESPVETPLTTEQLDAFANMRTLYPSTVITNDDGADMGVEYVADTKNYIDKAIEGVGEQIQAAAEAESGKVIDKAVADKRVQGNPLYGKRVFLAGDSRSSTDYSFYKTTLEAKCGCVALVQGASGKSASYNASDAYFERLANNPHDFSLWLVGGNDKGATVGTFSADSVNGKAGETVVTETDISVDFADLSGVTFVQAIDHIMRKYKALYYNFKALNNGHQPKMIFCTDLPQQRSNSSSSWSQKANWERKRNAIIECCEKNGVTCLDLYKLCGFDMSFEPYWTEPTDKVNDNGLYFMDGLHPNQYGIDIITSLEVQEMLKYVRSNPYPDE